MLDVRAAPRVDGARSLELPSGAPELRAAGGRAARQLVPGVNALHVDGLAGAGLSAFVEGLICGAYRFTALGGSAPVATRVDLHGAGAGDPEAIDAIEAGRRAGAATVWARDLANTPAGIETPSWLAEQARLLLEPHRVEVIERDVEWLTAQGFGGVLAVGGGSANPPRLIQASWRPRGARPDVHVVLVGKGITFDTGGINRKVGANMRTMHTDMSGGAAVLAAVRAIAAQKLPVRVTALVPAAENSLSGSSYRPGDVVRHVGGRTSEITNTDAEGRLVLADALAYAVRRLRPTVLVDIATLTGAMKVALGLRTGGVLSTSDSLAEALVAAGTATGEPLWRMPLPADYESTLHSDIADANQAPGNPGGITAALFLRPFAGGLPWAHLDIAGPARSDKDDGAISRGATGFGARLLHRWVESLA